MHLRNIAKCMIRTFKAHLISIIFGVDPQFSIKRWDLLLNQAKITVNLLRTLKLDPTKSAWEFINGPFNYNATPMVPPGSCIIAHAKGATCRSWDFRGIEGFYISLAMNHYQCYTLLRHNTQAVVASDTVIFRHHTLTLPALTTEDSIIHCLCALTTAIQSDRTPAKTDDQLLAIKKPLVYLIHIATRCISSKGGYAATTIINTPSCTSKGAATSKGAHRAYSTDCTSAPGAATCTSFV